MITSPLTLLRFRPTFTGWSKAAHYLLQQGIPPSSIEWLEEPEERRQTALPELPPLRLSREFLTLAQRAACHRHPDRWTLLYQILWRLVHGQSRLMQDRLDPDMTRLYAMVREVDRDVRHLVNTVHFVPIDTDRGPVDVAWFVPQHHIVELAAPQIGRKQGERLWSLLTPDRCAHWNGRQIVYAPGDTWIAAGSPRQLERLWQDQCAGRFGLPLIVRGNSAETALTAQAAEWNDLPLFQRAA